MRICDLGVSIEESWLEERTRVLHHELAQSGLSIQPVTYLGDEWFSPEGQVAISIPFYLAHPRLMALERTMMLEVEGETEEWCQKLLRHEAGHCFDHAYSFSKTRKWRRLFGSPNQEYAPENYRPKPYSRSFVKHLSNWYAQAHPDEDFAETFAVWIDPNSQWQQEYSKWPVALAKLQYVDEQSRLSSNKPWIIPGKKLPYSASRMTTTLENYYAKRKRQHADEYPDFYDEDLKRIFNGGSDTSKRDLGAASFMRRNQKSIIDSVSRWTGERKFPIHQLVRKLQVRCESLRLRLGDDDSRTCFDVASYLATLVTNYLHTGKFKRTV